MRYFKHFIVPVVAALALMACSGETKVRSVSLSCGELAMQVGEQFQIEMKVFPISASVYNPKAWRSSDPSVATVDARGVVTALSPGSCTITGYAARVSASCSLTVLPSLFEHDFDHISIFGQKPSDNGNRRLVVKMHNGDITVNDDGSVDGNGRLLNLMLVLPGGQDAVAGHYEVDSSQAAYSVMPGAIEQIGLNQYAVGSYLGDYSNDGLSVLFVVGGTVDVVDAGGGEGLEFGCNLSGDLGETIVVRCKAAPHWIPYREVGEEELRYDGYREELLGEDPDHRTNLYRLELVTPQGAVELFLRIPLSVDDYIPDGIYYMSPELKPFTMVASGHEAGSGPACRMLLDGGEILLAGGELLVERVEGGYLFSAELLDEEGNRYIVIKSGDRL